MQRRDGTSRPRTGRLPHGTHDRNEPLDGKTGSGELAGDRLVANTGPSYHARSGDGMLAVAGLSRTETRGRRFRF